MIKIRKKINNNGLAKLEVDRITPINARVGVLGVGHHVYWDQFEGLKDDLLKKLVIFTEILEDFDVEIEVFGISDNSESAYKKATEIKSANLDLLFVDMLTYATSGSIAAIFREVQIPIVLVALQPEESLDYKNASTYLQLLNDDICAIPEFMNTAIRMGRKPLSFIIGTLYNDKEAIKEIGEYCQIAKVLNSLRNARIGQMGHVLEAMFDMHTDPTKITSVFGCHIVQTEPNMVLKHYLNSKQEEVDDYKEMILKFFDRPSPKNDPITEKLKDEDLETAAKVGVALQYFIKENNLDGLAYYYEGQDGSDIQKVVTNFIVGNSLLTAGGFPMCGELDLKTCLAMLIMDRLEMGGSFAEFHPIDFKGQFVLVGHDGPHHINIADGLPVIRSLKKYHGKPGMGAGVEFKIKSGPITMLSIAQKENGEFKFIIAEGESKEGAIPPTGNTNTRGFFEPNIKTFLGRWFVESPTHHFALGIGHKADIIKKIGEFLNIETVIIPKT